MKKYLIACICLGLGFLRGADTPAAAAPGLPAELHLTNGAVLRRITVVRWEADRMIVRHAGGIDPVQFTAIAETQRPLVLAVRDAEVKRVAAVALAAAVAPAGRIVVGQVFVGVRGAGSHRLAGAQIRAYALADLDAALAHQRELLPGDFARLGPGFQQDVAVAKAWDAALADRPLLAKATADADGKYSISLPGDQKVFLVCFAGSLVAHANGQHTWIVPLGEGTTQQDLSTFNRWVQPK